MKASPTAMLVILDGWGCQEGNGANAVRLAQTPNFNRLWETCPHSHLVTHGRQVGLPDGQMGNSEVGHLTIGSGRVVSQSLPRVSDAAESGDLAERLHRAGVLGVLKGNGGRLHLIGLASKGGVHSHID
ncbi:MAG: 2,3-bisphosphoglycerate-independent phosphoglycerate mutase, partial [Haliea sp.]